MINELKRISVEMPGPTFSRPHFFRDKVFITSGFNEKGRCAGVVKIFDKSLNQIDVLNSAHSIGDSDSASTGKGNFFVGTNAGLLCYSDTGAVRADLDFGLASCQESTPLYSKGHVYIGDAKGNLICLNVANKKIDWCSSKGTAPVFGKPALFNDEIWFADYEGNVFVLDPGSGQGTRLLNCLSADGSPVQVFAGAAASDKEILFVSKTGEWSIISDDRRIKSRGKVDAAFYAQPTVLNDMFVAFGSDEAVFRFSVKYGAEEIHRGGKGGIVFKPAHTIKNKLVTTIYSRNPAEARNINAVQVFDPRRQVLHSHDINERKKVALAGVTHFQDKLVIPLSNFSGSENITDIILAKLPSSI